MKRIILFLIIFLAAPAFAEDKSYTLTDTERQQWQQFAQSEKQLAQALDQAVSNAINAPVGAQSQAVHANIQQAGLSLELVRARRDAWLLKLQSDHDCKGCQIEADKLTRPKQ